MTTRYKPSTLNHKAKQLQWLNGIVHLHDCFCECDGPLQHTIGLIVHKEPEIKFNTEETDLLKKCLTTGENTAATTPGDGDIDFGDLERLFTEDDGEDGAG